MSLYPEIRVVQASLIAWFLGAAVTVSSAQPTAAPGYFPLWQESPPNITDLALIYCGSVKRLPWTPAQLAPYVSFKDPRSGKESWLFDGFLYIEYVDGRGHEYAHGYKQASARKQEWSWLLERFFAPGQAVGGLDQSCQAVADRLGTPTRRRQVVLTLPEPIFKQKDWGTLHGRPLDFSLVEDRVAACGWYVNTALAMWRKSAPKNLDLAGFYWVAEHSWAGKQVLPKVAQVIHSQGKQFFWIPYWKAAGATDWRHLGFDVAYQQPNYFFHPEIPRSRLDEACTVAKKHGMGLELEFDLRLQSSPEKFRPRLPAYLNAFERDGVAAESAMAYYEGGGALRQMAASKDRAVRQLYREVARFALARQQKADALARHAAARAAQQAK